MNLIKRLFRTPKLNPRQPVRSPFAGMSTANRLDACLLLGRYDSRIFEGW